MTTDRLDMSDWSRAEHLAWCKERALEYANRGDRKNALASMMSDLSKHPETEKLVQVAASTILTVEDDPSSVRRWVEGFN